MSNWHHSRRRALRYVGSKVRIVPKIAKVLHATGAHTLIDVFGGSGAVCMNAGFTKNVFNDLDSDVVHFFRVLSDDAQRVRLIARLQSLCMSRELFDEFLAKRAAGVYADNIERAIALFYVSRFAFGGKVRSGGFAATVSDRVHVKEISSYFSVLAGLEEVALWWKGCVIENLHYQQLIKLYARPGMVLYCDPPYIGTETHYTIDFTQGDHVYLAEQLNTVRCPVVLSYYDSSFVRELYRETDGWSFLEIPATKNSQARGKSKQKTIELLICRGGKS